MRRMRIRASRGLLVALALVVAGSVLPVAFAGDGSERVEPRTVARVEVVGEVSESGAAAAEPKLTLRAPRQLFLRPRMPGETRRPSLDVEVSARLEDLDTAENLEDYYCLEEVWDWDDDTESVYEPDCDPYEEGSEIETFFFGSHRFSLPGTYRVWLRLQRSGETVIAGNVVVRIRN